MTAADRRIAAGIFVLVLVTYGWFSGGAGWNQNVNLNLTRALVEQRTIRLDALEPNTGDISIVDGHIYSNKAPGLSMLAALPYAVIYAVERAAGVDPSDTIVLIINLWLCTVAVCAVPGALLAVLIYAYGRTRARVSPAAALVVALLIAFGTYIFPYATVLFAHVPSAFFLFLSFYWGARRPASAGAAAGVAVLCYYFTVAVLPLLAALVILETRSGERLRALFKWAAGGAPFALLLFAYHRAAFGSPFHLALESSDRFIDEDRWLGVMGLPRADLLVELLVGRFRGLLPVAPILILCLAGAWVMWRRRILLRDLAAAAVVFMVLLLLNAGFNGWHGGSAIGPRYILQAVPFLAIPLLFATSILRWAWIALGTVSVAINVVVTAVNPMPPWTIESPLDDYLFPMFATGSVPPSTPPLPLYDWKIMPGYVSVNRQAPDEVAPYVKHRPGSREAEWASFNLGEIWFEGSRWSLAPIVLWMVIGALILARAATKAGSREHAGVPPG